MHVVTLVEEHGIDTDGLQQYYVQSNNVHDNCRNNEMHTGVKTQTLT